MQLTNEQKTTLIEALLQCSTMSDQNSRITVVNNLRDDIKSRITTGNNAQVDIEHIVTTCNNFKNGIIELIDRIRFFEGNSTPMKNLEDVIRGFSDSSHEIEFVNRVNELSFITNIYCPPYLLISAPMGYGKTRLLESVSNQMQTQGWLCIFVKFSRGKTYSFQSFSTEILNMLEFTNFNVADLTNYEKSANIIGGCINKKLNGKRKIMILCDEVESLGNTVINEVFNQFVPSLIQYFQRFNTSVELRFIFSGRYLSSWELSGSKIPLKYISLTPFDFVAVRETIEKIKGSSNYSSDFKQNLTANLMYFIGGHPGCMIKILNHDLQYYNQLIIANNYEDSYFNTIVTPLIEEIKQHIPDDLKQTFERLSVLRRFTPQMLRIFIDKGLIDWKRNEFDLEDRLLQTYLVNKEEGFLKDDITRRLLSVYLRKTDFDSFKKVCSGAIDFFRSKLSDLKSHRPDIIAIELLFQLLQDTFYIQCGKESDFLNILPEILDMLVKDRDEIPKMEAFRDNINKDWEFQFYVNYFFRKDNYNDVPFQNVMKQIDIYINALKEKR